MQISAEIHWFWEEKNEALTKNSQTWFDQTGIKAGGGGLRDDVYLLESDQIELGIKARGGKPGLELKGLISYLTPIQTAPFYGGTELWGKWSTGALDLPAKNMTVAKMRWLRKFDFDGEQIVEVPLDGKEKPIDPTRRLPTLGCHVERTRTEAKGIPGVWWTVGFEAFGPAVAVERILLRTVDLFRVGAPDFTSAFQMNYPRWLKHVTT